jgi:23S rRNA (pseudouridine1915-N3)-methyltransferase
MFHIHILALGKNKDRWVDEAVTHYLTLLKKFAVVSPVYLQDVRQAKNLNELELRRKEAILINSALKSTYQIALSDKGKLYDSIQFARFLERLMQKSAACDFLIGGIYGLDESIIKQSQEIVSLSPMTLSHQLIRPVLLEQLYRAFSIISGGKYHK